MASRVQVRINGVLGTPAAEQWSIGFNYAVPAGGGQGDQTVMQALAADFASYLSTATAYNTALAEMGNNAIITEVEAYGYQGPNVASAAGQAQLATPKPGGGTGVHPYQVARVISLQTGLPGARYRGRFYVPALAAPVGAAGLSFTPAGFLTAWALLLEQPVNLWTGSAPLVLGVYSQASDVVTPVTSLRVGNVLDTQRRRRESAPETYTVLAL